MEIIKEGYIRVSDIIGIYQNYASVPREKLRKSQEIGTVIHDAIENFYKHKFVPIPPSMDGYFRSFIKWISAQELEGNLVPVPQIIEERFYCHKLMITGRVDLVTRINDSNVLVDFKTGSWAHPKIWQLQATFYRYLIPEEFKPDHFIFLQLDREGEMPTPHMFEYSPDKWEVCEAALKAYHYFKS